MGACDSTLRSSVHPLRAFLQECCSIRDVGLAHLTRLSRLQVLILAGIKGVGDRGAEHHARLSALTKLILAGTSVTDEGVSRMIGLLKLVSRDLEGRATSRMPGMMGMLGLPGM